MSVRPLPAGRLRHEIAVKRQIRQPDGKGGYLTAWTTVATIRAEVTGLDGRESVMEKVMEGVSVFLFRVRWRRGLEIRASDQVRYAGLDLNVKGPSVDPDGRRRQLTFIAETASAQATS
ncbi:conserved hypothetical protein [Altererythrobacter sp. B11]|uniref:head-tail adaptor protein n=1 Tax=Altererythrobacter sp. B11 TaxID=2060312 RepID=UPI000DC72C02|nr:head-tail adaptor protein [Altererythrobacter sp. B11]BBC72918.1 conserved hypothetical protein [Altererythrobacter sp. B11]